MKKLILKQLPVNIGMSYSDKTPEEHKLLNFKVYARMLLSSVPDNISDDNDPHLMRLFQEIFDKGLNELMGKYPGYNSSLYIHELIHNFTEYDIIHHKRTIQIKVSRFLKFLTEASFDIHVDNLPKTFISVCNSEQLKKLRKSLIDKNFICSSITEEEFIYIFSGKLITKGMKRIEWKSSKVKAKKLLNRIVGEEFGNPIGNKCFVLAKDPNSIIFDSNVKLTTSYPDIDKIVNGL